MTYSITLSHIINEVYQVFCMFPIDSGILVIDTSISKYNTIIEVCRKLVFLTSLLHLSIQRSNSEVVRAIFLLANLNLSIRNEHLAEIGVELRCHSPIGRGKSNTGIPILIKIVIRKAIDNLLYPRILTPHIL